MELNRRTNKALPCVLRAHVEVGHADGRERQRREGGAARDIEEGRGEGRGAGGGEQEGGGWEERSGGLQDPADIADAPAVGADLPRWMVGV